MPSSLHGVFSPELTTSLSLSQGHPGVERDSALFANCTTGIRPTVSTTTSTVSENRPSRTPSVATGDIFMPLTMLFASEHSGRIPDFPSADDVIVFEI